MEKKQILSTEVFKNKKVPEFFLTHEAFKRPIAIKKVFPSIGLHNFKEKANIDKCLVDIKKEGTYVHNLLRNMTELLNQARNDIANQSERIQYLGGREEREKNREKLLELGKLSFLLTEASSCTDPYNQLVIGGAIQTVDNKIVLKLIKDIPDPSNNGKLSFRKDESLFKVYSKLKDKCTSLNINLVVLDTLDAFKTFCKENIPNKEFNIVFSSDGEEGAWDIATMSMRGIKSCQRWDGEYPKCLIGSILSKFVGIIYLTSGVQADTNAGFMNLGTKMMRRCVVRYAIDADENKPCILVDKMYPDLDRDILNAFINALKTRTKLPVHYSQELTNRLRHIYLPHEKIREDLSDREMSYQDTPLKSKNDLNVFILNHNKDEVEREIKGFRVNLSLFIARHMERIYQGYEDVDPEIKKTVHNIRVNTSFTPVCESFVNFILSAYRAPPSTGFVNSRTYYRKYLMEILLKRKQIINTANQNLINVIKQSVSRDVDTVKIIDHIMLLMIRFTKLEAKNTVV